MHWHKTLHFSFLIFFMLCTHVFCSQRPTPTLANQCNSYQELCAYGLIEPSKPIRLHLGCGQKYLSGYVNIDFASDEHTVQTHSVADCFADITQLGFAPNTIDEVRLHHLFEHFTRAHALALLCQWHQWLKIGGMLTIETPDFFACCKALITANFSEQQKLIRHIFGSQEAHWAIHYDGWYTEKFEKTLKALGFKIVHITKNSWSGTYNICITVQKEISLNQSQLEKNAYVLLHDYTVNSSPSEKTMLNFWRTSFQSYMQSTAHQQLQRYTV